MIAGWMLQIARRRDSGGNARHRQHNAATPTKTSQLASSRNTPPKISRPMRGRGEDARHVSGERGGERQRGGFGNEKRGDAALGRAQRFQNADLLRRVRSPSH